MDMLSGEGFTKIFAPVTCNRTLALLKTMGQQAIAWGIIEINQANKIKLLKKDNTRTCYFTLNEMLMGNKLLAYKTQKADFKQLYSQYLVYILSYLAKEQWQLTFLLISVSHLI